MNSTATMAPQSNVASASLKDYFTLLKPGVMSLVVFTGAAGIWMAPGHLHPFYQIITILCIALGSGAGAALNMWYDRDIDAMMNRTAKRPIPAGRIAADDALALGVMLSILSVGMLSLVVNVLAAAWLAFAIFFYAVIYTKHCHRRIGWCTARHHRLGGQKPRARANAMADGGDCVLLDAAAFLGAGFISP